MTDEAFRWAMAHGPLLLAKMGDAGLSPATTLALLASDEDMVREWLGPDRLPCRCGAAPLHMCEAAPRSILLPSLLALTRGVLKRDDMTTALASPPRNHLMTVVVRPPVYAVLGLPLKRS